MHENTCDRCVQVTGGKPARRGRQGHHSNIGNLAQFWRAAAFCVLCAGNACLDGGALRMALARRVLICDEGRRQRDGGVVMWMIQVGRKV